MRQLPKNPTNPNLIVGNEHSDDAGVYQLTEDIAIVQTVDYFTPIVDNPYCFGQIAAANALSDVYAMGGKPITALNIVGFPIKKIGHDVLAEILRGASDKIHEAGAITIGGHSIDDQEPKFGLSVTGIVHPKNVWKNTGAKSGDILILTKPIGIGIVTTAIKKQLVSKELEHLAEQTMATLNKEAAEVAADFHPTAVTDVTGFGLLGHAYEMASGSDVSIEILLDKVPLLPQTKELAEMGAIPGGTRANYKWLQEHLSFSSEIDETEQLILCDAVTSGGLLLAMHKEEADMYCKQLPAAIQIGKVIPKAEKTIYVK